MATTRGTIRFFEWEDVVIDVPEEDFEFMPECCIYKVPKSIREVKPEAYTPQLISIGPFHYGNENLAEMETQKFRYLKKFCKRTVSKNTTLETFLSFIKQSEGLIRNCYAKSLTEAEFESAEFIKMILRDAIFIIELFLRKLEETDDFLINRSWLCDVLDVDLMLLENQLPFFVLEGLYELVPLSSDSDFDFPSAFLELACNYFEIDLDSLSYIRGIRDIKHFIDLKRWELIKDHPENTLWDSDVWMDRLRSATTLYEAGVKFKSAPKRRCLLDMNFAEKQLFIPPLLVSRYTESCFRSVIAFEQCHYPGGEAYVTAYVDLMDHLIDTDKDVELLVKKGIILNRSVGSGAEIAGMVNKLRHGVKRISYCYEGIAKDLIDCSNSSFNRTLATLKQVYFNNLLRGTASVAAFLVVVFTFTQTLVAILERVNPLN